MKTAINKWVDNIKRTEVSEGPGYRTLTTEKDTEEKIQEYWIPRDEMLQEASRICGTDIKQTAFRGWTRAGFPTAHVRQLGRGKGAESYYPAIYTQWVAEVQRQKQHKGTTLESAIRAGKKQVLKSICFDAAKNLRKLVTIEKADIFEDKKAKMEKISVLLEQSASKHKDEIIAVVNEIAHLEKESLNIIGSDDQLERMSLAEITDFRARLVRKIKADLLVLEELLALKTKWNRIAWTIEHIDRRKTFPFDDWVSYIEQTAAILEARDFRALETQ